MEVQKEYKLFEELLLANPDFDESLLEKEDDGNYINCEIADQLGIFQAGIEVAEREAYMNAKAQVTESNALLSASLDAIQKLGSGDFVLVPKEPTEEMLGAAWEAPPVGGPSGNKRVFYEKQAVVYKAMVEEAEKAMIETQEQGHD